MQHVESVVVQFEDSGIVLDESVNGIDVALKGCVM